MVWVAQSAELRFREELPAEARFLAKAPSPAVLAGTALAWVGPPVQFASSARGLGAPTAPSTTPRLQGHAVLLPRRKSCASPLAALGAIRRGQSVSCALRHPP